MSEIPQLERVLCEIDKFSTRQNRENLTFLARAFALVQELDPRHPQDCLSARIKDILCRQVSTGRALPILQRMLIFAKYDPKRVSKLNRHVGLDCYSLSLAPPSDFSSKLSFFELLLIISFKIDNSTEGRAVLQHLLAVIPEADIGSAKGEIKSALQLFSGLLTSGALDPCNPNTLNCKLRECLCSLKTSDEGVAVVVADIADVMTRNVNVSQYGSIQVTEDVQDCNTRKNSFSKRKCTKCTCFGSILTLATLTVTAALAAFLVTECAHAFSDSGTEPQTIQTSREFTFLAPKSSHKYQEISFRVEQEESNPRPCTLTTCSLSCTDLPVVLLNTSDTYSVRNCNATTSIPSHYQCYVQFNESNDRDEASPYVLKNSSFTIEWYPNGDHQDVTAKLYLFYNSIMCNKCLRYVPNSSYVGRGGDDTGPIKFDRWNTSYSMQMKNDSFVCAYWLSTTDFNYTIQRNLRLYNFYHMPSKPSVSSSCSSSHITDSESSRNVSFHSRRNGTSQCVLANLVVSENSKVNVTMKLSVRKRIEECILFPQNIAIVCLITVGTVIAATLTALILFYSHYCTHREYHPLLNYVDY